MGSRSGGLRSVRQRPGLAPPLLERRRSRSAHWGDGEGLARGQGAGKGGRDGGERIGIGLHLLLPILANIQIGGFHCRNCLFTINKILQNQ